MSIKYMPYYWDHVENKSGSARENTSPHSYAGTTDDYVPYPHAYIFYVTFLVESVVLLLGAVGNGLLVITFAQHKTVRTTTNTYVLSIAITDLLVTFSCPFVMIVSDLAGSWLFGKVTCQVAQATMEFSTSASALTLTAVSIERFYAIVYPLDKKASTQRFTVTVNILIWIVAALFALPKFLNSEVQSTRVRGLQGHGLISYCTLKKDTDVFFRYLSLVDIFVFYVVPFCIICALYASVSLHLIKSSKKMSSRPPSITYSRQTIMRNKAAKMVLVLTAIFFVGFMPYNILRLKTFLGGEDKYWNTAAAYAYCFGCLHFFLNPVAIYAFCDTFRKHFNSYLFCRFLDVNVDITKTKGQSELDTTLTMVSSNEKSQSVNEKKYEAAVSH